MTCDDYLSMLETLPVGDLNYGEAREHVATCRDCNRVTRVVAERERNMIGAYGELYPSAAAATVAEQAIVTSRRRKVALFYRMSLAVAAVAAVLFIAISRIRPVPVPRLRMMMMDQTFMLSCLAPEDAAAMLRSTVSRSTMMTIPPYTRALHVVAPRPDMMRVRSLLRELDSHASGRCGAPAVGTAPAWRKPATADMGDMGDMPAAAAVRAQARAKFQMDAAQAGAVAPAPAKP